MTDHRSQNVYCVVRLDASGGSGIPGNLWLVNVKRQGRLFHRSFFDNAYGGRDSAFTMAVAYRDALLRIFPPLTQLQQRIKIRSNNKSGMAGVSARYDDNRRRLKAWVATMDASGVTHQKYFSVKEHGEEKAKELAIAARKELLTLYRDNKFVTVNANATQAAESAFPALLNEGANQEGISPVESHVAHNTDADKARMTRQLELLNAWFDALRPQFAHLRLSVYPIAARGHDGLFIVVGNAEVPGQLRRRSWHIQTRTYAEILPLAWEYAQKIITEQMGIACWEGFKEKHKQTVFESTAEQAVFIRYRYDAITESSLRATPPSELMPMLQDFSVPPLPPAQIISSVN